MHARSPSPEPPSVAHQKIDGLLARWLPERYFLLTRFGLAGITTTATYFLLSNGLVIFGGVRATTASVAAYALSLCLSFVLQSQFAFRTTDHLRHRSVRFLVMSAVGFLVAYGVMEIVTQHFGWSALAGSLAVCILIPVMNYIVMHTWVFRPLAATAARDDDGPKASRGSSHDD